MSEKTMMIAGGAAIGAMALIGGVVCLAKAKKKKPESILAKAGKKLDQIGEVCRSMASIFKGDMAMG